MFQSTTAQERLDTATEYACSNILQNLLAAIATAFTCSNKLQDGLQQQTPILGL